MNGEHGWLRTAWVAGVFSALVAGAMLLSHIAGKRNDPLQSPQLRAFKETLRDSPENEQLKGRIRQLDLELRRQHFRHLSRMGSGVYLLLGGVAVLVFAASQAGRYRKQLPMPKPKPDATDAATRAAAGARWSVAASGTAIGVLLFVLSLGLSTALPERAGEAEKPSGSAAAVAATTDAASADELKANWPRFRGADGGGASDCAHVPVTWDAKTGAGILWKVPVPASGFNSPIVWGDRVFLSGGGAKLREVFCLDAKTGQMVWHRAITIPPPASAKPAEVPDSTGYAASTMATDGRRIYVMFANGDLAALTLDGQPVWTKTFGPLSNPYGHATSLATWRDRLILQLDQGESDDNKSKLYALDGRTGQIVWQKPRKVGSSWATPIVIEAAGKAQVITLADPFVIAYAASDGTELWRVGGLSGEITPSPAFAGGLVLAVSPSDKLLAIRPDGQGDVTKTHVQWTVEDSVPDITSPVSDGKLVFMLNSAGMLTCLDLKDGKKQWDHDFDMEFHTSPSIAGGQVYLFGQKGTAVVVEAARQFKEVFHTEMGDDFHASPAFAQDRMFLRGVTNVWCVGEARGAKSEVRSPKSEGVLNERGARHSSKLGPEVQSGCLAGHRPWGLPSARFRLQTSDFGLRTSDFPP